MKHLKFDHIKSINGIEVDLKPDKDYGIISGNGEVVIIESEPKKMENYVTIPIDGKIKCKCGNLLFDVGEGNLLEISGDVSVQCKKCDIIVFLNYKKEEDNGRRKQEGK